MNSRLMVRKLWDVLRVPTFALVDADPHGTENAFSPHTHVLSACFHTLSNSGFICAGHVSH